MYYFLYLQENDNSVAKDKKHIFILKCLDVPYARMVSSEHRLHILVNNLAWPFQGKQIELVL